MHCWLVVMATDSKPCIQGNLGGAVHAVKDNMDPTQPRDSEFLSFFVASLFLQPLDGNVPAWCSLKGRIWWLLCSFGQV